MNVFIFRARIISILCILGALVLIAKLYIVQVARHEVYVDLADKQYVKKTNALLDRGIIYMTTKDGVAIPAASVKSSYTLYINAKSFYTTVTKKEYKNAAGTVISTMDEASADLRKRIEAVIGTTTEPVSTDVFSQLKNKPTDPYEEIVKELEENQSEAVKGLGLTFLGVVKEKKRHYPGGDLASQVIGLMGYKGDTFAGRYGLEKEFDT
ncbi:MAG: hypothetical protein V4576_01470, partial [Patescibacteria group bacterium]